MTLKFKLYIQFFLALIPVFVLLAYQGFNEFKRTNEISGEFGIYEPASVARSEYNVFLNGVEDAVDSGQITKAAIGSLSRMQESLKQLTVSSEKWQGMNADVNDLIESVSHDPSLRGLMDNRVSIVKIGKRIKEMVNTEHDHFEEVLNNAHDDAKNETILIAIVAFVTLLIIAGMIRSIVLGITIPLHSAIEIANQLARGEVTPTLDNSRDDKNEFGQLLQAISSTRKQLLGQSHKDPLTGLPNRIAIDEILTEEINRNRSKGEQSAILYLDLDKFKDINDKLGHSSGDRLLKLVAMQISGILREEDVLARLGGDEFLLLLPNSSADKASLVAKRIVDVLSTPFVLSGNEIIVSTSVGIYVFPEGNDDCISLLQKADAAMYEAKRQGGNRFVFYRKELGEHIHLRLQLQKDFLRALQKQEFVLHYQPLVDLSTGKIIGAEALVRWMDPQKGLRFPDEFIPFAEESGVILPLGEWVLKTACKQAQIWASQGNNIYMAVNLSTRQFKDPELFTKISNALAETGLPPNKLELEITESASMHDPEGSIHVMDKLKSIGIRIAIDDFGTGYSSLTYLKRIPADVIKIDRSFVKGLKNDPDDLAIVLAILALGNALDKHCLAEGIETIEHFEVLNKLGCHFGQGYWMSKPVTASEFTTLLATDTHYLHPSPSQVLASKSLDCVSKIIQEVKSIET